MLKVVLRDKVGKSVSSSEHFITIKGKETELRHREMEYWAKVV